MTTVIVTAVVVVSVDAPHRLDLWTAEFFGTAIVLAVAPLLLMRWLRVKATLPILLLPVVVGAGLAHAKRVDSAEAAPAAVPATRHRPLPTASDGFGAYARPGDSSPNS